MRNSFNIKFPVPQQVFLFLSFLFDSCSYFLYLFILGPTHSSFAWIVSHYLCPLSLLSLFLSLSVFSQAWEQNLFPHTKVTNPSPHLATPQSVFLYLCFLILASILERLTVFVAFTSWPFATYAPITLLELHFAGATRNFSFSTSSNLF